MRSKYFDTIIISTQLAILAFSSYKLFFEQQYLLNHSGNPVASLEKKKSTVKIRAQGQLHWSDATRRVPIQAGDRIFTAPNSSATIKFTNNSQIVLRENALIKIEQSSEKLSINITKGNIIIEDSRNMQLRIGKMKVQTSGANTKINIQSDGKNSTIALLNGEATLEGQDKLQQITANSSVDLNSKGEIEKVNQYYSKLLYPTVGSVHYLQKNKVKIDFEFKHLKTISKPQIIISDDPSFTNISTTLNASHPTVKYTIRTQGLFYWKIIDASGKNISPVESFEVIQTNRPKITSPTPNSIYEIIEDENNPLSKDVLVRWDETNSTSFKLEIHEVRKNTKQYYLTTEPHFLIQRLPEGQYQIRVANIYNKVTNWSAHQAFTIKKNPIPLPPLLIFPRSEQSIVGNETKIQLKPVNNVTYHLSISNPQGNQELDSENALVRFSSKQYGNHCIKAAIIDSLGRKSLYTEETCFNLMPSAPNLTNLPQNIFLSPKFKILKVEWSHQEDLSFQLQISQNKNFKAISHQIETNDHYTEWSIPAPGSYYFRMRSQAQNIWGPYSEVKKLIIKPMPKLEAPPIQPGKIFELSFKKTLKWIDLIIASAHADSFKSRIEWKAMNHAENYHLEIFDDANGERLILSATTQKAFFDWENATPGQYYWRLSYTDLFGRKSPKSKIVPMIIKASKKWKAAQKNIEPVSWKLELSHAFTNLKYEITGNINEYEISGGSPLSINLSLAKNLSNKISVSSSGSFLKGTVLENDLTLFRNKLILHYMILTSTVNLKAGVGAAVLMISHSPPLENTTLSPILTIQADYKCHLASVHAGLNSLSASYRYTMPIYKKIDLILGIEYFLHHKEKELHNTKLTSLTFLLGGGIKF